MSVPKNADKFLSSEVVRWKKKDFIKQFEDRFENAEEIYNHFAPQKKKKNVEKED